MHGQTNSNSSLWVALDLWIHGTDHLPRYQADLILRTIHTPFSLDFFSATRRQYSAFGNFFPNFVWFKKIDFWSDWAQIFRKDSLCHPPAPNFFFGRVIFKITAEFRFLVRFHGNVPYTTRFSETLFDYNTLVFCSIFLKFLGKTSDAIFLPQFSFRVVIFSLRPEFRFLCTFSRST